MYARLEKIREWLQILIDVLLSIMMGPYALIVIMILKMQPLVESIFTRRYTDFKKESFTKYWEKSLKHLKYTLPENIEFICEERKGFPLKIITRKKMSKLDSSFEWEGGQIIAKDKGFNFIRVKMRLDFEQSSAEDGNVALWALGNTEEFRYVIGIDRRSGDIFAHCMDDKGNEYIKERARTHFKDYLKEKADAWVVLGIKWELSGVRFFIYDELSREADEYLFRGPLANRELREKIMKDASKTYLHGVKELWIRTDLVARDIERSIVAEIEYVDVRKAFLSSLLSPLMKIKSRRSHKYR